MMYDVFACQMCSLPCFLLPLACSFSLLPSFFLLHHTGGHRVASSLTVTVQLIVLIIDCSAIGEHVRMYGWVLQQYGRIKCPGFPGKTNLNVAPCGVWV